MSLRRTLASVSKAKQTSTTNNVYAHATGIFRGIPQAPPDPILGITASFRQEANKNKINLSVGAYRDANGNPWVLPSIKLAYDRLVEQNKEYTGINGSSHFKDLVRSFLYNSFDQGSQLIKNDRISISQTLSGTGALKLTGEFMNKWLNIHDVYVPNPTWANHLNIFQNSGLSPHYYTYFDQQTNSINFNGLVHDLSKAKEGSAVLLHACCHNPTGLDPTPDQWAEIIDVVSKKHLVPIVDLAYQGFQSGSLTEDLHLIKLIISKIESGLIPTMFLSQSFAKNMGLYGERVGSLSIVAPNSSTKEIIDSQMQKIIRSIYSSPPIHGSKLVEIVLSNDNIYKQWEDDVLVMSDRIKAMRWKLFENLQKKGHDWSHLITQNGMFCFTGLNESQVLRLKDDYGIYCTLDGRFSISGINDGNIDYLTEALHNVLK